MSLILSGTDGLSDVDGSAATPAIRGTDANTGIFFGADIIGFAEGGVESMRIDSSGNVGIGTSSPTNRLTINSVSGTSPSLLLQGQDNTERLHITSAGASGGTPVFGAFSSRGTTASPTAAQSGDAIGYYQFGGYDGSAFSRSAWIQGLAAENYSATNRGSILAFSTTPNASTTIAERMRIDSSGNVGIGTASPSTYSGSNLVSFYAGGNNFAGLTSINSNSGTGIGGIQFGSDSTYVKAAIGLLRSGANGQGSLVFYNDSNADAANWATTDEKMRIDTSGNLLVGGTTAGARITAISSVNDLYSGYNGATAKFAVNNSGTIFAVSTTISSISDIRYKENVRDLDVGLDKIMALKPRLYDWKEGKGADIKDARGFIAQEFEIVFPDLVDEWKDPVPEGEEPYKSVRQDLIPVLVKAIQEQQALITALTDRITALETP